MNNVQISVTLQLPGAVRLLRTAKKVETKISAFDGLIYAGGTRNSHDVTLQEQSCSCTFIVPGEMADTLPSFSERRRTNSWKQTEWDKLPFKKRLEAHLRDIKHDRGAISLSYTIKK